MNPQQINQELTVFSEQFPSVLDDFKKAYIAYNSNPTYGEYQSNYSNLQGIVNSFKSNLFVITNKIQKNIDDYNQKIREVDDNIRVQKILNVDLKKQLGNSDGTENGSAEMIDAAKESYNVQYRKNVVLFVGCVGVVGILSHMGSRK